jgi:hypothetical protein
MLGGDGESMHIPILSAISGEISFRGSINLISHSKSPSTTQRMKMKKIMKPSDLSVSALSGIFRSAKSEVLGSRDSWLTILLAAVEALPIAFSLASAKEGKEKGFPLIYVNKYFEKLTGYSRRSTEDSILGNYAALLLSLWFLI